METIKKNLSKIFHWGLPAIFAAAYPFCDWAGVTSWWMWAGVLIIQNYAFTYVSRARNSGSLGRHMKAALFSNGVWFASQIIIFSKLFEYISGKHGLAFAIATGAYYTVFTMLGSIIAHYDALGSEKGKAAVGANSKYAQIPVEEYKQLKTSVEYLMANQVPVDTGEWRVIGGASNASNDERISTAVS